MYSVIITYPKFLLIVVINGAFQQGLNAQSRAKKLQKTTQRFYLESSAFHFSFGRKCAHSDPQLQWAGKAEGLSFDVDTVSLHVHERIDPLTVIETVRKKEETEQKPLFHWFETKDNNPPIREAIEFYKHNQGWSNRLIQ